MILQFKKSDPAQHQLLVYLRKCHGAVCCSNLYDTIKFTYKIDLLLLQVTVKIRLVGKKYNTRCYYLKG